MSDRIRKRAIVWALAAVLVMLAALPAAAADLVYIPAIDTLSVSSSDCVPGNMYSVIVLRGASADSGVTGAGLLFIDQVTADRRGEVFVAFVGPEFPDCVVLLGGEFAAGVSSPVTAGTWSPLDRVPKDKLVLPGMLTRVEAEAFANCTFTHVYLGDRVTSIGENAFSGSEALTYIFIPESVTSIAANAFAGSAGVTIGCRAGSYAQQFAEANGIPCRIVD